MSKRNNVAYIKPADPKFLQQLKAQIGFKSGPSVDTKVCCSLIKFKRIRIYGFYHLIIKNWNWNAKQRQRLDSDSGSESDRDDEAPQVVVLKKGDLTAEEAEQEQKRIETGKETPKK